MATAARHPGSGSGSSALPQTQGQGIGNTTYDQSPAGYSSTGGSTAGVGHTGTGSGTGGNYGTGAAGGNYGIDINDQTGTGGGGYRKSVNGYDRDYEGTRAGGYDGTGAGSGAGSHHDMRRLETIVDRILRRGPPQSSLGNPGPLGLAAFAATTFILSCYNAGLLISTTRNVVVPMALWYGGAVQLAAGLWEYAANNTFGATAFCSYGAFWLSFATLRQFWLGTYFSDPGGVPPSAAALGVTLKDYEAATGMYLMSWTIFTGYMFIGSLRMSVALIFVFGFLLATFACLTAGAFTHDPQSALGVNKAAGWLGIITAFCAWYASAAVVINGTFGAQLFPIGVLGPLSHTTPGLPHAVKRRLTESKIHEDEPIAARDEKDA